MSGGETGVAFTNVPGIRERSLDRGYAEAVRAAITAFAPDLLVTYNAEPFLRPAARAAVRLGVPWVPIVMDGDDRMLEEARSETWNGMRSSVAGARGVAFLSHWAYVHAPFSSKFHVDGGIAPPRPSPDPPHDGPVEIGRAHV